MIFFWTACKLQLKRLSRQWGSYLCLLTLPVLVAVLGLGLNFFMADEDVNSGTIQVGILVPEGSVRGTALLELLSNGKNEVYFTSATSLDELEHKVAAGDWECGYILSDDLDNKAQSGEYTGIITRISSPSTILASVLDESISSALLEVCYTDIAKVYWEELGLVSSSGQVSIQGYGADEGYEDQAKYVLGGAVSHSIQVEVVGLEANPTELEAKEGLLPVVSVLRGLLAIFLFLFSLLCIVWFAEDLRSAFFMRAGAFTNPVRLFLPSFLAPVLMGALSGGVTLLLGSVLFKGIFQPFLVEAGWLFVYMLYLAGVSTFIGAVVYKKGIPVAILPFIVVACFILCPVFISWGNVFPVLGKASLLLPPSLYLYGMAGNNTAFTAMAVGTFIFGGAGLLLLKVRTK